MPYFGQEIFIQAQAKGPLTDQDYLRALDKNHLLARTQGIDTVMAEHQLDALIAPTGGPASLIDLVNGDPGGGDRKSTRLNSSHLVISYAVFCLKKKRSR